MKTTVSVKWFVAAIGASAVLLAGCGSNDASTGADAGTPTSAAASTAADNGVAALTADQIIAKAGTAIKAAKSYEAKGSAVDGDNGDKMSMDFKVAGQDLYGELVLGEPKATLLAVGGTRYFKANEAVWGIIGDAGKAAATAKAAGAKWVKVPAGDKKITPLFDMANIDKLLDPDGTVTKGAAATVNGTPTISVVSDGTDGGTLSVATVGEPYPVQVKSNDGSLMEFTGIGQSFAEIKAPAAADVVDLSAVLGG
jgi:hypothetical protein